MAANREAIDNAFNGFKSELMSYIFRLTANKELAEDVVQDTYIKIVENAASFKGTSSFKTWVFSIATNHAKNILKRQRKWVENAQDYGAMLHVKSQKHWTAFQDVFAATPEQTYEIKEHLAYCFTCLNKTLPLEQQVCLLLKEIYGFTVVEIVSITQLTEGKVKHAIANARNTLATIFSKRCAIVSQNGVCHQCSELTGALNPAQNVQERINKLRLAKAKLTASNAQLLDVRLEIVKSVDPLLSKNSLVTTYFLENLEKWVDEGKAKKVLENPSESRS